ncbi:zinc finger and BTB domain-containing protein 39 [Lampris incognitus]|uniref:zinc finger and BTB domain-containing protein 39 n=1 Tax=Lampris incognitus TaxID=2546036 RepID=UPI0024B4B8CF|nr:zinc finger and BTB domain-containing protein 39 [Lampris incognitus]
MRIRLQGPGHAASLLSQLNLCRQSRLYCDVFLQVGNRSFAAHRAVLACAGTYFRSLFARAQTSSTTAFTLKFISPANFERVLTFIYTGEILTDLIDVGVLYELAERLGISELVRACHATFPDLQVSVSANCKASGTVDLGLDSSVVAAGAVPTVSASSLCSSAASCSSLSSSAGPSASPTPAAASSPLNQGRTTRASSGTTSLSLDLKAEGVHSHLGYEQVQVPTDNQLSGEDSLLTNTHCIQTDGTLPPGSVLQLKTEKGEEEEEVRCGGTCNNGKRTTGQMVCGSTVGSLPQGSDSVPSDPCSFPDSSVQLGAEACPPTSSSEDPLGNLQVEVVEGGVVEVARDGRLMFGEVEEIENEEERDGTMERGEEEQWRQLAGEIIELSDDENYMEVEEDDEDDLVFVENGAGGDASGQVSAAMVACKACAVSLPVDSDALGAHAESHLTETGLCRVCGATFADRAASVSHALSHVGVQLFSCDMCHLRFCSKNKLLRHHRQAASNYTLPQAALANSTQSQGSELQCAVCNKSLNKQFQNVRDHLLSHVCPQSLSCGVCHLPQLSLCSLLWHTLTHLSVPIYSCPHCAHSFLERSFLERHMAAHAEEAAIKERQRSALLAFRSGADGAAAGEGGGGETGELYCLLCPQTFRSTSAFQYHLSQHSNESLGSSGGVGGPGLLGKRKADQPQECPSSSSPREVGGLVKMSNIGFGLGMGFNLSDKVLQGPIHNFPSGVLTNGGCGLDGPTVAAPAGVREKWYRCRYCGKRFAHSGEFTYHLRIHTGEKPYQCKVCLRFFRGRSTMICHLKTHAGALMYRCTVCGLYFSTLKLMSSHMELHKDHLPPDFNIEQTFMYNDHSKEPLPPMDT